MVSLGTAVWAVLLVGQLPFRARLIEAGHGWWLWACLVGTLLGVVGIGYCRRRRAAIARGRTAGGGEPPLREQGSESEPALREPLP